MAFLEIACFSAEHALVAWKAGADRIELCDNREEGGTTPSEEAIEFTKEQVTIPVSVMIRPRGGDFSYSDSEFEEMKACIDRFKSTVDGFVFGILDQNGGVDIKRTAELVNRARPLPCTFHRAFDEANDMLQALEDVISCGCRAILSSGGASNALAGADALGEVIRRAQGRISVIPGGGVRATNVSAIQKITNASMYHSSAAADGGAEPKADEIRQMKATLRSAHDSLP